MRANKKDHQNNNKQLITLFFLVITCLQDSEKIAIQKPQTPLSSGVQEHCPTSP